MIFAQFVIVCSLLVLLNGASVKTRNSTKATESIDGQSGALSDLENTLALLSNLTVVQKEVLEQQKKQELLIRDKNRQAEERELAKTKTLEEEQKLLREMRAKISRKLKNWNKKTSSGIGNEKLTLETLPSHVLPKDCADLYLNWDEDNSGIYRIWPNWRADLKDFLVYCDMETDGGGWTVIHRWGNYGLPKDYYRKPWNEYKTGFGDLETAFWLGTEKMFALTNQGPQNLRLDFETKDNKEFFFYEVFWIESESYKYKLHVDGYDSTKGTAGNLLSSFNNTDFVAWPNNQCTANIQQRPAWWYSQYCNSVHMDARLRLNANSVGDQKESEQTDKREMKIRPVNFLNSKESG